MGLEEYPPTKRRGEYPYEKRGGEVYPILNKSHEVMGEPPVKSGVRKRLPTRIHARWQ